jgi:hypothetical protein
VPARQQSGTLRLVSRSALLQIEEKAQELIHLDAVRVLVEQIYALDVSKWNDEDFAGLEAVIDKLIALLSASPIAQHRPYIEKLLTAREGIEQGLSPDPSKRPTAEQMRAFVSAHLP